MPTTAPSMSELYKTRYISWKTVLAIQALHANNMTGDNDEVRRMFEACNNQPLEKMVPGVYVGPIWVTAFMTRLLLELWWVNLTNPSTYFIQGAIGALSANSFTPKAMARGAVESVIMAFIVQLFGIVVMLAIGVVFDILVSFPRFLLVRLVSIKGFYDSPMHDRTQQMGVVREFNRHVDHAINATLGKSLRDLAGD